MYQTSATMAQAFSAIATDASAFATYNTAQPNKTTSSFFYGHIAVLAAIQAISVDFFYTPNSQPK
jgi:hypothetical protein